MKVKPPVLLEVNDDQRAAIAHKMGRDRKADNATVCEFWESVTHKVFDEALKDAMSSYYTAQAKKFAELAGDK